MPAAEFPGTAAGDTKPISDLMNQHKFPQENSLIRKLVLCPQSNILDIYPYFHIGLLGKGPSTFLYAIDNKYIYIMAGFGA